MTQKLKNEKLDNLCNLVRKLCSENQFSECLKEIYSAMQSNPDSAIPHNLLGIVLEKTGDHLMAMRHFRAALALEPSYMPSNQNLQVYGTFFSDGQCAYDESDVMGEDHDYTKVVYDERGIGHVKRCGERTIEYDNKGVGHIVMED